MIKRDSLLDELEAQRHELPLASEGREHERWSQVVRDGRARLAVVGAPGSGKAFIARHRLASVARASARQLEDGETSVDEIMIPLWVTAQAIAQAEAREIGAAFFEAAQACFPALPLSSALTDYWQQALVRGFHPPATGLRLLVAVDALDELLESHCTPFQVRAAQLDRVCGGVIVTCRTMRWSERRGWLGWAKVTEELAPFETRAQREFGRKFFRARPALAQRMERRLQTNLALRHACTNPLLLTFACLLGEEGKIDEHTMNAKLYGEILPKLVSDKWRRVKPFWAGKTVAEESCLVFLQAIA